MLLRCPKASQTFGGWIYDAFMMQKLMLAGLCSCGGRGFIIEAQGVYTVFCRC